MPDWDAPIEGPSSVGGASDRATTSWTPASPATPSQAPAQVSSATTPGSAMSTPTTPAPKDSFHRSDEVRGAHGRQRDEHVGSLVASLKDLNQSVNGSSSKAAGADSQGGVKASEGLKLKGGDMLSHGSKGDDVKQLQQMLNEQSGSKLKLDGSMGPETARALKAYQKEHGLKADGIVGDKTRELLNGTRSSESQPQGAQAAAPQGLQGQGKRPTPPPGERGAAAGHGAQGKHPSRLARLEQGVDKAIGKLEKGVGKAVGKVEHAAEGALTRGKAAIAQAESYLGKLSQSIKGHLPTFTAAGGKSNNCADFVSSVLKNNGMLDQHYIGVNELKRGLDKNPNYVRVSKEQAGPGDVWMRQGKAGGHGHTELVADHGAKTLIGSNNGGTSVQHITHSRQAKPSDLYYKYIGPQHSNDSQT